MAVKKQDVMITYGNEISIEDYNRLRAAVGWVQITQKRAAVALENAFYLCIAMDKGIPVGMMRVVSDGGYSFFIVDVIVHPDYQGLGIGTKVVTSGLEYIQKDVLEGETIMVSLMAAFERESFYKRFGFHQRPFENHGSGMSVWVTRDENGILSTY